MSRLEVARIWPPRWTPLTADAPHHILIKLVCRWATAAALPVAYGDGLSAAPAASW